MHVLEAIPSTLAKPGDKLPTQFIERYYQTIYSPVNILTITTLMNNKILKYEKVLKGANSILFLKKHLPLRNKVPDPMCTQNI